MKNLLQAFADAWNRHDLDAALMSMMTTDCVFEASGGSAVDGERHQGNKLCALPTLPYSSSIRGTGKDGKRVEVTGCDLFTFRTGKIAIKNSFRKNRVNA